MKRFGCKGVLDESLLKIGKAVASAVLVSVIALTMSGCGKKDDVSDKQNNSAVDASPVISDNVIVGPVDTDEIKYNNNLTKNGWTEGLSFITNKEIDFPDLKLPEDASKNAKLAIVIDDLGGWVSGTDDLMKLDIPLTVAIMPLGEHVKREAEAAAKQGFSIILHQPMEPINSELDMGPGAITVEMSDEEIRQTLRDNVSLIPGLCGISNHMGSKATSDPRVMQIVLEEVKDMGMFFFDSVTLSDSVVTSVANSLDMKTLINVKFLDNQNTEEYVTNALLDAANIAKQRGYAAVIGHVRKNTMSALKKVIPQIEEMGVEFVTLDELYEDDQIDTRLQFVAVKHLKSTPVTSNAKDDKPKSTTKTVESREKAKDEKKTVDLVKQEPPAVINEDSSKSEEKMPVQTNDVQQEETQLKVPFPQPEDVSPLEDISGQEGDLEDGKAESISDEDPAVVVDENTDEVGNLDRDVNVPMMNEGMEPEPSVDPIDDLNLENTEEQMEDDIELTDQNNSDIGSLAAGDETADILSDDI